MTEFRHLEDQLDAFIEQVAACDSYHDLVPRLPSEADVTVTGDEIGRLVFETGNVAATINWYLGIARGRYDRVNAQYNRAWKSHRQGSNEAQRDASAVQATEAMAREVEVANAQLRLLQGLAKAAQYASESARKILDTIGELERGYRRSEHGLAAVDSDAVADGTFVDDFDNDL